MKVFISFFISLLMVLLIFTACEEEVADQSIAGTWIISGTIDYYQDSPPDIVAMTLNQVHIFKEDGSFSGSGTAKWATDPEQEVLMEGTYVYDETAQTLAEEYTLFSLDGVSQAVPDQPVCGCVIEGDVMTITFPDLQTYSPAEPLAYNRQ